MVIFFRTRVYIKFSKYAENVCKQSNTHYVAVSEFSSFVFFQSECILRMLLVILRQCAVCSIFIRHRTVTIDSDPENLTLVGRLMNKKSGKEREDERNSAIKVP